MTGDQLMVERLRVRDMLRNESMALILRARISSLTVCNAILHQCFCIIRSDHCCLDSDDRSSRDYGSA